MIFVILGSQKFQFNRLLKAMDEVIEKTNLTEPVFAQIGYSDYLPKHYPYKQFLDAKDFDDYQSKADIIVTHCGTGAIINAVKKGKKVLVVPRLEKYGEHVDDHQIQIADKFEEMGLILSCRDGEDLGEKLREIRGREFRPYISNTNAIIQSIDDFIQSL